MNRLHLSISILHWNFKIICYHHLVIFNFQIPQEFTTHVLLILPTSNLPTHARAWLTTLQLGNHIWFLEGPCWVHFQGSLKHPQAIGEYGKNAKTYVVKVMHLHLIQYVVQVVKLVLRLWTNSLAPFSCILLVFDDAFIYAKLFITLV